MTVTVIAFAGGVIIGFFFGIIAFSAIFGENAYMDKLQEAYDQGFIDGYDHAGADMRKKEEETYKLGVRE